MVLDGFGWFWLVLGGFGWFRVLVTTHKKVSLMSDISVTILRLTGAIKIER